MFGKYTEKTTKPQLKIKMINKAETDQQYAVGDEEDDDGWNHDDDYDEDEEVDETSGSDTDSSSDSD